MEEEDMKEEEIGDKITLTHSVSELLSQFNGDDDEIEEISKVLLVLSPDVM